MPDKSLAIGPARIAQMNGKGINSSADHSSAFQMVTSVFN
jgi:hypothetical protein